MGVAVAALAMAATACGDSSTSADRPPSTPAPSTTAAPSTAAPPTRTPTTPSPTAAQTTSTPPGTAPTTSQLGPEWTQQDGRVLIEAVASGDTQQLLADMVALGLTDGVAFGRLVNGWLPAESFDDAQRLATVKFLRPTGADTGAGG
jgi:hypothetical protein